MLHCQVNSSVTLLPCPRHNKNDARNRGHDQLKAPAAAAVVQQPSSQRSTSGSGDDDAKTRLGVVGAAAAATTRKRKACNVDTPQPPPPQVASARETAAAAFAAREQRHMVEGCPNFLGARRLAIADLQFRSMARQRAFLTAARLDDVLHFDMSVFDDSTVTGCFFTDTSGRPCWMVDGYNTDWPKFDAAVKGMANVEVQRFLGPSWPEVWTERPARFAGLSIARPYVAIVRAPAPQRRKQRPGAR